MSVLQQNYAEVCRRIAEAEQKAGRQTDEVGLIAVSKTFPSDDIREVYAAGQRDFGENYIQEWYEKTETLADLPDIVWHVIGDVQSNKTKFVAERAHWVHTIGRLKTAWDIRGVKDVRVLGAIGVIELEKGVDMARFQADCVAQGIWVRPFGRLVYLMPPYIISDDLLTELADKTVHILKEHNK